jgi:hypothetical protein
MGLEFLDEGTTLVCLLMEDNGREIHLFEKPRHSFARPFLMPMDEEDLARDRRRIVYRLFPCKVASRLSNTLFERSNRLLKQRYGSGF